MADHPLEPMDVARLLARLQADAQGDQGEMLARAWAMGARAASNAAKGRRICRICGCWELQACEPDSCCWVERDLCSRCDTVGLAGA